LAFKPWPRIANELKATDCLRKERRVFILMLVYLLSDGYTAKRRTRGEFYFKNEGIGHVRK
jgi:hypothetical protein